MMTHREVFFLVWSLQIISATVRILSEIILFSSCTAFWCQVVIGARKTPTLNKICIILSLSHSTERCYGVGEYKYVSTTKWPRFIKCLIMWVCAAQQNYLSIKHGIKFCSTGNCHFWCRSRAIFAVSTQHLSLSISGLWICTELHT